MPRRTDKKSDEDPPSTDSMTARRAAIGLLARRDLASMEIRLKLERKGYSPAAITAVIEELTQERLLDDSRYATHYVSYHAGRGEGPIRIEADLRALGLPAELIETALASGPDWRALARDVRTRRFGPEKPAVWAEKARQARFLQYRGFSSDHIRSALGADIDLD